MSEEPHLAPWRVAINEPVWNALVKRVPSANIIGLLMAWVTTIIQMDSDALDGKPDGLVREHFDEVIKHLERMKP